jgi:hypothetical protein
VGVFPHSILKKRRCLNRGSSLKYSFVIQR